MCAENVFCVDLDSTLIFSDEANFLAYKDAIFQICSLEIDKSEKRLDHLSLKELLPFLDAQKFTQITTLKAKIYPKYLAYTKINEKLVDFLKSFYKKNHIYLNTNASQARVELLLHYHKLEDLFALIFCNTWGNKYQNLIDKLNLKAQFIIAFEDDEKEILNALKAGLQTKNIIKVKE